MKNIAILGSTGSIGTQTLEIVRDNSDLRVVAMSAGNNIDLFEKQIREFKPRLVSVKTKEGADDLKVRISDMDVRICYGMDGLTETAVIPDSEILVTGIVGMIGITPTIAAINEKKTVALANKETLVTAGHIIMPLCKEKGVSLLPVDSEHSAIFQSLQAGPGNRLSKILLTASGGPFRGKKASELSGMTAAEALKHPNWSMGKKVTIDSASLCNKGLEVMEAHHLFGVDIDDIEVLLHPQSILHSAVEFEDGAIIGQMGAPDMKLPIEYALFYPDRRPMTNGKKISLADIGSLTFEKPDTETFRGLALAIKAGKEGGSVPTVFNAANEEAVRLFLDGKIGFLTIYEIIERAFSEHTKIENPSVSEILEVQKEVEELVRKYYG